MNFKFLLLFVFTILGQRLIAQSKNETKHHHNHDHHIHDLENSHHALHKNEIGIANSLIYFVKEKELTYGFHD